jgi:hypothetical protein
MTSGLPGGAATDLFWALRGGGGFAPLREIGETIMDTFAWMPTAGLSRIHMDPESRIIANHAVSLGEA